jgi:hypothetical protein
MNFFLLLTNFVNRSLTSEYRTIKILCYLNIRNLVLDIHQQTTQVDYAASSFILDHFSEQQVKHCTV